MNTHLEMIHIGAPKTASTTLQKRLFNLHPELTYIGVNSSLTPFHSYQPVVEQLNNTDDLFYNEQLVTKFIDQYGNTDKTLLWSHEGISGCAYPSQVAKRLKTLLPNAHILLTIRNQLTALTSYYSKHGMYLKNVPKKYLNKYVPYDQWLERSFKREEGFPIRAWRYHEILGLYEDLFGKDKIHILFFEDFVNHQNEFTQNLSNVLHIDETLANKLLKGGSENTANPVWYTHCYRIYNAVLKPFGLSFLETLGPKIRDTIKIGKTFKKELPPDYREKAIHIYRTGNQQLAERYGILDKMKHYGYPL